MTRSSLCNLCVLCVSVVRVNHGDTENTEVAQRNQKAGTVYAKTCSILVILICLLAPVIKAQVQEEEVPSDDPVIEARLQNLSKELRCLQCQNQTLADSPAGLAADLRREIRIQMKAGKSDKEIIAFLTQRYGDFILYKPRVTLTTYLLWFGPFVLLLGGLYLLFHYIKQRRDLITEKPLSADERRRAEELLASLPGKETT